MVEISGPPSTAVQVDEGGLGPVVRWTLVSRTEASGAIGRPAPYLTLAIRPVGGSAPACTGYMRRWVALAWETSSG